MSGVEAAEVGRGSPADPKTDQSGVGNLCVARHDEEVAAGDEVDLVGAEILVDRREHAQYQRVVQLVDVQPLAEDAVVGQVAPDAGRRTRW